MFQENRSGIYNSPDEVDFYVDKQPVLSDSDLNRFAYDILYNTVYRFVQDTIVTLTDSLDKIDYLYNDLPYLNNPGIKP
jgi:hypothetical protein